MKTRAILCIVTVACFGLTLAATQDAWAWGEGRAARGSDRVALGKAQASKAKLQRSRVGRNLRRGVGYGLQVPGAAVVPKGNTQNLRRKATRGFKAFAGNLGASMTNTVKARTNIAVGRVQQGVGLVQQRIAGAGQAVAAGVALAGNKLWNSKGVSFMRLMGAATGIVAGKAAHAAGNVRRGLGTKSMAAFVANNGGNVPTAYKAPAPVPANQLLDMANQLQ